MIKITEKSIDVQKIIDTVSSLSAGAVNVFVGTVRNNANGKNVLWLEYEAYETMAVAQIRRIMDEASHRWPLLGWAVSHRIGTLKPAKYLSWSPYLHRTEKILLKPVSILLMQ